MEIVKYNKKIDGIVTRVFESSETTLAESLETCIRYIFNQGYRTVNDIGAIVSITSTPDYLLPHTSCIVHGMLPFSEEVVCLDLPYDYSGYIIGLMKAYELLDIIPNRTILLCTGDVRNRLDKQINEPLHKDAVSVTLVSSDNNQRKSIIKVQSFGEKMEAIFMRGGGCSEPIYEKTLSEIDLFERKQSLRMNVDITLVEDFLERNEDKYIGQLYDRMGITPCDHINIYRSNPTIDNGLMSSLIPYELVSNRESLVKDNEQITVLSTVGSGLIYAGMILTLGNLMFCEQIDMD